jgi:RHS repeat-associated protein
MIVCSDTKGQYEDSEIGLYYNRLRYYSPIEEMYLSQYYIGLWGGKNIMPINI